METPPLHSDRLLLRPLRIDDAPALHEAYRDPGLMRWWSSGPHATLADTIAYLQPGTGGTTWRSWAITVHGDDAAIGTLSATERRPHVTEIGYLLARSAWGRGYAREAVARLIDWLIADQAVRRVYADCDPDNIASIALLEALGFRREGLLRAEWETHIGVRDSLILGLLASEWASRSRLR